MVDTWTGPKSGARYQEYLAAQKYGQAYTPGQGAGTALKQYTTAQEEAAKTAQAKTDATRLEEINKRLAPIYNPLTELVSTQKKAAETRYAANQADLKNIFGSLSTLGKEDAARINKQFTDSIAKQQVSLAARTAEQRAATAAGTAQAVATGAERGSGPAMAVNPISVAAEQGISNSNAIMTNWQGLMQANQAQAGIDAANRGAGYGQQQVGALAALSKNFEATMADLGGQEAQLKSQIAAATQAAQDAYAAGDAAAAAAAEKAKEEYNLQLLKNQGAQNVANTQATAKLQGIQMQQQGANSRASSSVAKPEKLTGLDAVQQQAVKRGVSWSYLESAAQSAYNAAFALLNPGYDPANPSGYTRAVKTPTKRDIISAFNSARGGSATSAKLGPLLSQYLDAQR